MRINDRLLLVAFNERNFVALADTAEEGSGVLCGILSKCQCFRVFKHFLQVDFLVFETIILTSLVGGFFEKIKYVTILKSLIA